MSRHKQEHKKKEKFDRLMFMLTLISARFHIDTSAAMPIRMLLLMFVSLVNTNQA